MWLYDWIVEHAVILGIAIDSIACIVTVALSIAIYKLERRHEKEREEGERRAEELARFEAAKTFLIDNDEELEYLSLAQVANNLFPKRKHCRKVITRYLRCDKQLQQEILRQVNVPFFRVSMTEIQSALEKLQVDLVDCGFGRCFLYDEGKYLHRALMRWAKSPIDEVNPYKFADLKNSELYDEQSEISWRFSDGNTTLSSYMWDYLHPEEVGLDRSKIAPPVDMVFQQCHLDKCDEKEMTFWAMRIIIDFCYNIMGLKNGMKVDESIIQTQEDMYYYTLLLLCETYAVGREEK